MKNKILLIPEKHKEKRQNENGNKKRLNKLAAVQPKLPKVKTELSTPSMYGGSAGATLGTPTSVKEPLSADVSHGASSVSSVSGGANVTPVQSKGNGHQRKPLQKMDYSDFSVNGTAEEQEKWFKAKITRNWRCNKLTSSEESAYRAKEHEHTKNITMKGGGKLLQEPLLLVVVVTRAQLIKMGRMASSIWNLIWMKATLKSKSKGE